MSEFDRPPTDRLHDTLTALRRDSDGVPLAGSAAARRRGAQRARRQAVGSVAAGMVLLGGVVGVATQLGGDSRSAPVPPATQVPTTQTQVPTTPSTTTPTTAPDPVTEIRLADNWQLRPGDLRGFDPYKGFADTGQSIGQLEKLHLCTELPRKWGAKEARAVAFVEPDLEGATIHEYALRYADEGSAAAAVTRAQRAFGACPRGSDKVTVREPAAVNVGDEAFTGSRLGAPEGSEYNYYELGVARKGTVVVVLQWSAGGNPNDKNGPKDPSGPGGPNGTPLWDEARLGLALERAIAD